jgi:acyl carrier protein
MTQKKLRQEVVAVLVKYLNEEKGKPENFQRFGSKDDEWIPSDITDEVEFKQLGLDSLDMVELLMVFEDGLMDGDLYLDEKIFRTIPTFGNALKEIGKYVKRVESEKKEKATRAKKSPKKKSNKGEKQAGKKVRPRKKTGTSGTVGGPSN